MPCISKTLRSRAPVTCLILTMSGRSSLKQYLATVRPFTFSSKLIAVHVLFQCVLFPNYHYLGSGTLPILIDLVKCRRKRSFSFSYFFNQLFCVDQHHLHIRAFIHCQVTNLGYFQIRFISPLYLICFFTFLICISWAIIIHTSKRIFCTSSSHLRTEFLLCCFSPSISVLLVLRSVLEHLSYHVRMECNVGHSSESCSQSCLLPARLC